MDNIYKQKWERLQQMIADSLDEIGKAQEVDPASYLKIKGVLLMVLSKWINKIDLEVTEQAAKVVDSHYIFDTYNVKRAKVAYDRKTGKLPVFDGTDDKSYRYLLTNVEVWADRCKFNKQQAVDK